MDSIHGNELHAVEHDVLYSGLAAFVLVESSRRGPEDLRILRIRRVGPQIVPLVAVFGILHVQDEAFDARNVFFRGVVVESRLEGVALGGVLFQFNTNAHFVFRVRQAVQFLQEDAKAPLEVVAC